MIVLEGKEGLLANVGQDLGYGPWLRVTQERINQFAEATGDHQWIHVDVERAKTGPYGKTIAHGLLTLSMLGVLSKEVFSFQGFKMGINYGYERVRFPSPVPVDSNLRLRAKLLSCEEVSSGSIQTVMELMVEVEGATKPACVAQMMFRHVP
ncbi:MaoC family dehydratase [Pseudomonas fluorescens]|nr:MaoC family dehydratase [Pseudomonas fluorescens]